MKIYSPRATPCLILSDNNFKLPGQNMSTFKRHMHTFYVAQKTTFYDIFKGKEKGSLQSNQNMLLCFSFLFILNNYEQSLYSFIIYLPLKQQPITGALAFPDLVVPQAGGSFV